MWKANHWGDSWGSWQCAQEQVAVSKLGALLCDPTYVCDYFNESDDVATTYIAQNSILFWDDHGGTVYEGPLGVLIGDAMVTAEYQIIHECIGGDSGAMMLLPWEATVPKAITKAARTLLKEDNAVILRPKTGIYYPYCVKSNDSLSILARS